MERPEKKEAEPDINDFDLIAPFYDELVSWAPYELWINDLLKQLKKAGLPENAKILDAACGSGLSAIPLARKGFDITGVDRSRAMLEFARKKAEAENLQVKFRAKDLVTLDLEEKFDAVICMHSGLDYILDMKDLQTALSNVRECLKPGGLFAFDKCLDEPDFYKKPQRDIKQLSCGQALFDYRWDRKQQMFEQDGHIYYKDSAGNEKTVRMLQRMRAISMPVLLKMVGGEGFETLKKPVQFTLTDPGMGIFKAN